MARVKVNLDSNGMRELLNRGETAEAMRDVAEDVASRARADAPVRTGEYRSSIEVVVERTDRAVARVLADVPYAAEVEADRGTLNRALGG